MLESKFRNEILAREIKARFPGAVLVKPDESHIRSFPDRIVLYRNTWAALETKRREYSPKRPNQEYYINMLNEMSYANFVYPENIKVVLSELEHALRY